MTTAAIRPDAPRSHLKISSLFGTEDFCDPAELFSDHPTQVQEHVVRREIVHKHPICYSTSNHLYDNLDDIYSLGAVLLEIGTRGHAIKPETNDHCMDDSCVDHAAIAEHIPQWAKHDLLGLMG